MPRLALVWPLRVASQVVGDPSIARRARWTLLPRTLVAESFPHAIAKRASIASSCARGASIITALVCALGHSTSDCLRCRIAAMTHASVRRSAAKSLHSAYTPAP
jgi:hypothetical protein